MQRRVEAGDLCCLGPKDGIGEVSDGEQRHPVIRPKMPVAVDVWLLLRGGCVAPAGSRSAFVRGAGFCNTAGAMTEMSLPESQLFRMLVSLFGKDSIVWNMSVRAVCGGEYPEANGQTRDEIAGWAEAASCLFTLVDGQDNPKLVIEFAPDFASYIELKEMERHQRLPAVLEARGIQYVSMSRAELEEMMDPSSSLDLISFLKDRFGIDSSDGDGEEPCGD